VNSPSHVAIREVAEESGYHVRVTRLLGVLDRDKQGHAPIPWHVYNLYFMCEVVDGMASPSSETSAVAWFERTQIPPLSLDRIQPHLVALFFDYYDDPTLPAVFD
jgi:ADP-ribose pyrophosphatase YjhB (NUDIX family)